jgi:glycine/D-amino acid oxidase-like deaminating enzyme
VKHVPFWVDDYPRPRGLTSDLPSEADVVVVGSGFTGLSAALRLAEAGRTVTVIDEGEIAGGASSINGGMVSPDIKGGVGAVEARHGPKVAAEMWASSVRSIEIVEDLTQRLGIEAMIFHGGMAALGRGDRDRSRFASSVAWYRERFGVEWEVLGPDRIGEVVGGDFFDTALFEPEGYGVHPARLAFGLASQVKAAGAILVASCRALSIVEDRSGRQVRTNHGPVRAGEVVLATNGYTTPYPSRKAARLVVPIGSYIITTEPLGPEAAKVFPGGSMSYTKKRLLHYMRRTPDDRILIGGRRNLHTGLDPDESAADLRKALTRYFPWLADVAISHSWGGKLGVPFDLIPKMGKADGAWYAMGYGGHGVGLSLQLGHELAGMILGEDPPSVFSQVPNKGRFYYNGRHPWFLTPASILYRTLDRFGM